MEKELVVQEQYTNGARAALDPLEDGVSSLELVRVSGSDLDVVNAARVSYGKISTELTDRDKGLITYLMNHNHTSPFEHNQLSFRVKCPIFVARQWMRHRMNSYNEISYRYVKAPVEFYIPKNWRKQDDTNRQCSVGAFQDDAAMQVYTDSLKQSYAAYETLLESGVGREIARGLLPTCTYTEFIFTCNLHSLLHFIELRTHPGAQYEIRVYAQGMAELVRKYFPFSMEAFAKKPRTR